MEGFVNHHVSKRVKRCMDVVETVPQLHGAHVFEEKPIGKVSSPRGSTIGTGWGYLEDSRATVI